MSEGRAPGDALPGPSLSTESPGVRTPQRWINCGGCGRLFLARLDQEHCQPKCRAAAWRRDHPTVGPPRQASLLDTRPVRELDAPPQAEARRLTKACRRILARLSEGPATNYELAGVGGIRFGARLKELRDRGHRIEITERDHETGRVTYRLEAS